MSDKRQQLIMTALKLFNVQGFAATGIDRILAESGIAKRTLYRHFPSKEALIKAVLVYREQEFFALLESFQPTRGDRCQRLDGVFAAFAEWFARRDFYGCNFVSASAEFPPRHHLLGRFVRRHKQRLQQWLAESIDAGEAFAVELCLLLEGAVVMAQTYGQPQALEQARQLAQQRLASAALSEKVVS